jgi:CRP-like cAMP-binding protein
MTENTLSAEHDRLKKAFESQLKSPIEHWETLASKFYYREMAPQQHWIKAGNEVNQHFYQANEAFAPLSAIISEEACQYYVEILEPTQLMLADYNDLYKIGAENPAWLRLEILLLQTVFVKNARREARLLLGNAEQRYKWFCKEYPELIQKLPQYHIASFLGITPVSLSRLRKKIEA